MERRMVGHGQIICQIIFHLEEHITAETSKRNSDRSPCYLLIYIALKICAVTVKSNSEIKLRIKKKNKNILCAQSYIGDSGYRSRYLPHAKRPLYHLS